MSQTGLQDLERRLTALESQNRRLRGGLALAATAALALPVLAAFAPFGAAPAPQDPGAEPAGVVDAEPAVEVVDEIRARRLVLVDERGTERVVVGTDAKNTTRLSIHDDDGLERVAVGVDRRAAFSLLFDDQGRKRIGMACDAFPHLMLNDHHQKQRVHASVGITGAPSLLFLNQKGDFTLGMGLDGEGNVWHRPSDPEAAAGAATSGAADVAPESGKDDRHQPGEPLPPEGGRRKQIR